MIIIRLYDGCGRSNERPYGLSVVRVFDDCAVGGRYCVGTETVPLLRQQHNYTPNVGTYLGASASGGAQSRVRSPTCQSLIYFWGAYLQCIWLCASKMLVNPFGAERLVAFGVPKRGYGQRKGGSPMAKNYAMTAIRRSLEGAHSSVTPGQDAKRTQPGDSSEQG